jgi:tRNA A-37 threonylcarbamoyl transferase component Bud32
MHKIVVNSKYDHLKEQLLELTKEFSEKGNTIYDGRNILKTFELDGINICIKSFKKPNMINKWVYAYFRKSKARRSYEYAVELQKRGINTPEPVAYIEEKSLVFGRSFYICLNQEYDFTLRELYGEQVEDRKEVFRQFTEFSYSMHQNDVFHIDYSPGNVLIKKQENGYFFSVIDINRMQFKKIDLNLALVNLSKIWASDYMYPIIAEKYAKEFNAEYDDVLNTYMEMEMKHKVSVFQRRRKKKKWKKIRGKA